MVPAQNTKQLVSMLTQAGVQVVEPWHPRKRQVEYGVNRHVSATAQFLHSFPGLFLKETQPARSLDFVAVWVTYKF